MPVPPSTHVPASRGEYFTGTLAAIDPEVHAAIAGELARQQNQIELIASENIVSSASLEALRPEFKEYAARVLANARALAAALMERGVHVVTGGTDTPLLVVDLRDRDLTGDLASDGLERAGLTCNKNTVPGDPKPPTVASGLRFGVSAGTTRGFNTVEFETIGHLIADVLDGLVAGNGAAEGAARAKVGELCHAFPIYPA